MTDTPTPDVCRIEDIGLKITGADAPPMVAAINDYLSVFAKPVRNDKGSFLVGSSECLKCGKVLDGALGTFQWGIAHGEGMCGACGWPARAYHRPKDENGEIFDRALDTILQYHPSQVAKKEVER